MAATLNDPIYKTYVAQKLRDDHPELKNATDDEVLQVVRKVEIPDATDQEWEKTLNKLYPDAPHTQTNYAKWVPGVIAAGAIGIGAGVLGGLARRGSFKAIERAVEPKEIPLKAPEALKSTPAPEAIKAPPPEPIEAPMATEPGQPKKPSPIKPPSSRALHVLDPVNIHILRKIESNPEYLDRLAESGGGKTIPHTEIWNQAFNQAPMSIDELANWKPEQRVNTIDLARANILRVYWLDEYMDAVKNQDIPRIQEIEKVLTKIEPGYNNLSATPGRTLEFQKVVQFRKEISDKISELKAINAPYSQIKRELEEKTKELEKQTTKTMMDKFGDTITHIEDYATAAKLTSPVTHAVNTISNMLTYTQRGLEKSTEAGIHLATGNKEDAEAAFRYAWGTLQGLQDGTRKFLEEFQTIGGKEALERGKGRIAPARYVRPVFQLLSAADSFWKAIIHDSEIHMKAFTQASKEEGLKGTALAERIKELVENPQDSWKEEAAHVAKEYTFQEDPGRVLKAIQAIQHIPFFGRIIVPFVTTPYNILTFYNRRSIFGGLSPRFWKDVSAGGKRRVIALSRLSVGLGITAGALGLANTGTITGAYPSNPKERSAWEAEGKRPWSIKVGNHWFQYNRLQPIGLYLMTVAAIRTAVEENNFEKAENKFGKAVAQLAKGPLDLPFLQGLSSVFDVINDPERSWNKFVQLTAVGFIPNILRDVRSQMDPIQRKPKNVIEALENITPGLSQQVPARISVLGKEVKAEPSHILRATKMITTPTEDEKTRLMDELGWAPPAPKTTFTSKITGEDIKLEGDMLQQYLISMGRAADEAMSIAMKHPKFDSLSRENKIKVLQRVTEKLQSAVRKKYQAKAGVYGEKGKNLAQETEE